MGLFKLLCWGRRTTGWTSEKYCVNCEEHLSDNEVYYSDGMCPRCAHSNRSTIVDTYSVPVRHTYSMLLGFIPVYEETEVQTKDNNRPDEK